MEDLRKDVKEIRECQIRMEADLKYHIKRTDLLETRIESFEEIMERMRRPLTFMELVKIAGVIATIVSLCLTVLKMVKGI